MCRRSGGGLYLGDGSSSRNSSSGEKVISSNKPRLTSARIWRKSAATSFKDARPLPLVTHITRQREGYFLPGRPFDGKAGFLLPNRPGSVPQRKKSSSGPSRLVALAISLCLVGGAGGGAGAGGGPSVGLGLSRGKLHLAQCLVRAPRPLSAISIVLGESLRCRSGSSSCTSSGG